MSTQFYHCRWRVYAHNILEEVPGTLPSQLYRLIEAYKLAAGDAAYDRKYCAPCYRKHVVLARAVKQAVCSRSCPDSCPIHEQLMQKLVFDETH